MIGNSDGGLREVALTPAQARRISVLILTNIDGQMDIQEPTYSNDVWVHFDNQSGKRISAYKVDEHGKIVAAFSY